MPDGVFSAVFDFREEMQYMFDHDAKACANHYFNRFNKEAEWDEE